jgi:peroxiredoxin
MLAAALPVLASAQVQAQGTTPTEATANPTTGSATTPAGSFNLEPGDQLIYSTNGNVAMSGAGQQQDEAMDIMTSITVLEKSGDTLTLYAALTASEETTSGKTQTPGPRFTFQMPSSGSQGMEEFEKAGLAGSAFPTFSVETIFAAPPAEGKSTVTVAMPITNAVIEGEAVTTREGDVLKTVTSVSQGTTPVLSRTTLFSSQRNATQSINTSVSMSITGQNIPITFSINDKTELQGTQKLPADQLEVLKNDVEMAIPVASKLRTLSMSSPEAMKAILDETKKYLEVNPKGEFAPLFSSLHEQLASVIERTTNWENIKQGEAAPDFTATTIDNKQIKLSNYKGKVVLLDFWATWCGPCLMELPHVKKLYEANKEKGFEIIGISADETIEDLTQLVEQENLQWPQIFDGGDDGGEVQKIYGVMKYPTTILVDAEGKIHAVDLRGDELDKAVAELLESKQ